MEYYTTTKKNEILPFAATCMHLEISWSKSDRERKIYDITYTWNPKKIIIAYMKFITNRNWITDLENKHCLLLIENKPKRKGEERQNRSFELMCTYTYYNIENR